MVSKPALNKNFKRYVHFVIVSMLVNSDNYLPVHDYITKELDDHYLRR